MCASNGRDVRPPNFKVARIIGLVSPGVFVVIAAGLLLTLPALFTGFPYFSHDGVNHATFYSRFSAQLWAGELYPRWLPDLNAGFGGPTFFYYPPGAYYFTSLFKPFFPADADGWRQLGASAAAAMIFSGLAARLWLKRLTDERSATLAALLYLVLPYHLAVDLYTRGALAEFWSFVWMPLVLLGVEEVSRGRTRAGFFVLAVSYALLVITHLPTTLIFSPLPVVYALWVAGAGQRVRAFAVVCGAMLLGAALAGVYLIPAMTMQRFIFIEEMTVGHYRYENWFLFRQVDWAGPWSFLFWAAVGSSIVAACLFYLCRSGADVEAKRKAAFWALAAGAALFMMTPPSRFVWESLPVLQRIQFPWRLNAVLCLALAALSTLALRSAAGRRTARIVVLAFMLPIALHGVYEAATRAQAAHRASNSSPELQRIINSRWSAGTTNEFRPRWVASFDEPALEALRQRIGRSEDGRTVSVTIVRGAGAVRVGRWQPRDIMLEVDAPEELTLNVSQFYFPGWRARLDEGNGGGGEPLEVRPSVPGGLLRLTVPAGQHRVSLRLERRWPEFLGQAASLAAACVLLLAWLMWRGPARRAGRHHA